MTTKNKNGVCNLSQGLFLEEKKDQSHHISRKQTLSLPYLNHRLLYVTNIRQGFQKIIVFSLTSSQIWLHPHLD
jgi:hypothetical protein